MARRRRSPTSRQIGKHRGDDLERPRGAPGAPSYDPDAFARMAERMARFLGTGRYLAFQTILVVFWITLNVAAVSLAWDPYPFILLNLAFSTQAAYAAPLILLAQNRQADRERADVERDRKMNERSLADTEFLAREMAGIRLALERKADNDDMTDAIDRLTRALVAVHGEDLSQELSDDGSESISAQLSDPEAD